MVVGGTLFIPKMVVFSGLQLKILIVYLIYLFMGANLYRGFLDSKFLGH
jgi:hypothetical protein